MNRLVIVTEVPEIEHVGVGKIVAKGSPQLRTVQVAAPLVSLPV